MTDLITHLKSWGLEVDAIDGYTRNGRPGSFSPRGVLCHHTASGKSSGNFGSLSTVVHGRGAALPGPLCQILLGRNGDVKVISTGRTNHAGYGGPWSGIPKDQGNTYLWGIEAENDGLGEPWSKDQYEAYVTLCAALMKYSGIKNSINVFAHREWAPDRKTDPRGIDMPKFRAAVAARLRKGPSKNIVVLKDIKVGKMHKDVVRIKRRLKKKGFIKKGTLPTPFYGKNLVKAYAAYQRSLGFKGSDASGAPGKTSLERLGFIVV